MKDGNKEPLDVAVVETPEAEMCIVHIDAELRIPKSDKEAFLASLREWGRVSEVVDTSASAVGAPSEGPAFDAYGNAYRAGSGQRPSCDAYGNPYNPDDRPPPKVIDQTTDNYGNKLVREPVPESERGKDERGRPLRDQYGNEYKGRY